MREPVIIDVKKMYEELQKAPTKGYTGNKRILTPDEQWILWVMYPQKSIKIMAKALHVGTERVSQEYELLEKQGGPKGTRPEWMK